MSMNTLSVLWFVKSGPDASHLCDVSNFETLRDAKAFAERVAYDELKWINYDNGWEALDSKGELFKITKTCKSTG